VAARKKAAPIDEQPAMSLSDQVIALAQLPEAERIEALKAIDPRVWYVAVAQNDDGPDGFECFYKLIFSKQLPAHAREWVEGIYKARNEKKGIVIEAFRGSTKTTTLTIAFTAWRIGKEPHRANLLVQVGDDIAADNTHQVADIIENNTGFKLVFPTVEPDRERGWGAGGYEVKRTDLGYVGWRELNAKRKDPTLVGVGYKSREIIGKHPDGLLVVDDIHDENNTASERELETVRKILTGTIFPTMTPSTWAVFVGTPWVDNDVLRYVASTGEFVHLQTPVEKDGIPVWDKKFGEGEIARQKRLAGTIQFARMFMLDLTAAKNKVFKYMGYPSSEVRFNWPMVGGVDYAGTMDVNKNKAGGGDYFAIAYVAKLPGGGAVVVDGVVDHCTQAQAEAYLRRAQEMFPHWLNAVVEGDGKGEEFIQVVLRNPTMKIIPMKTGGKGKEARLERQMGPWLESGIVRVSDAETPFLNELRRELDTYPLNEHDDALDAVYWSLRGMPDVLYVPASTELPPTRVSVKQASHPLLAFGNAGR